jgi:hypothetical protein
MLEPPGYTRYSTGTSAGKTLWPTKPEMRSATLWFMNAL